MPNRFYAGFSREHISFYFIPISLCPPINGIKSEFMPDRLKNGRPTLPPFDMKSDRYCVEPVCVCFLCPEIKFDMRACRKAQTRHSKLYVMPCAAGQHCKAPEQTPGPPHYTQVCQVRSWHVRRARPGEQQRVPSYLWQCAAFTQGTNS